MVENVQHMRRNCEIRKSIISELQYLVTIGGFGRGKKRYEKIIHSYVPLCQGSVP